MIYRLTGILLSLECGALLTLMEGAYGYQERDTEQASGGRHASEVFSKDWLFDEVKKLWSSASLRSVFTGIDAQAKPNAGFNTIISGEDRLRFKASGSTMARYPILLSSRRGDTFTT